MLPFSRSRLAEPYFNFCVAVDLHDLQVLAVLLMPAFLVLTNALSNKTTEARSASCEDVGVNFIFSSSACWWVRIFPLVCSLSCILLVSWLAYVALVMAALSLMLTMCGPLPVPACLAV